MDKTYFDIAVLVGKYLADNLTEEERSLLEEWIALSERNRRWFQRVTDEKYRTWKGSNVRLVDVERGWQDLQSKRSKKAGKRLWVRWCRYAAILVLPLLVGIIIYRYTEEPQVEETTTITSGTSKARLILANGTSISLEQQQKRVVEEENGTRIDLQQQQVVYENAISDEYEELVYNELVIPRGGEYSLTLSDGTVVYMNADSKLRFPVKFDRNLRMVELEGEAYFKVQRNEKVPFIVKTSQISVQVLGTEFNVSAYAEDLVIQTTLVSGAVKVFSEDEKESVILRPGEQAEFSRITHEIQLETVDVSYVTAWKDGRLRFQEKPLFEIMKNVARWYDVEIIYEDEEVKYYPFGCNFNRMATIESLLQIFEATGTIETRVQGRKIWIKERK
ncbi:FecR family protein [Odoribacter sp. AF15-53]|uniref:FecR family protein n=1 Tax=Odoribacter sp. AF15-53 TaxID=2292236 RepID=UPI000E4A141C|nr:FecR family protein [Odoribacter sp. AF15-53]RHR79043.1 FecR family protein [Odoribacter sp. AF15-53]